jgi:hypothetical protein
MPSDLVADRYVLCLVGGLARIQSPGSRWGRCELSSAPVFQSCVRSHPTGSRPIRAVMVRAVRGYADGEEFTLPMAARLIEARARQALR